MNLSFSVTESEYTTLRTLILVAYENVHNDLEDPKLSDISISAISRELHTLAKLKRAISHE
jgi:hypothetical protein